MDRRAAPAPLEAAPEERALLDEIGVTPRRPEGLFTARIVRVDGDAVWLERAGEMVVAAREAALHPAVLEGAQRRGERVLCERDGEAIRVLGALRTQPTAGIDELDELRVVARRIELSGDEVLIRTKAAALVLRAIGEIETCAERIISRAEGVHKIIGRMLRLN